MTMLTKVLLLFAFTGQYYHTPNIAATVPAPDFPLRVHFFVVKGSYHNGDFEGFGRADLLGTPPQGMDLTFECGEPFLSNGNTLESYPARWKTG